MSQEERYFTREEANAALPRLRESVARIRDSRRELLDAAKRVKQSASRNGGGADDAAYRESERVLREELEGLAAEGIILKDAESGLVDFPSLREGRVVQLCWKLGEGAIDFWHEVDAGFSNRKPL